MNERISVIVPVYKTEAYLDRCVASITAQSYSNLEIILVDDGSPDRCPAMCDAWAEKDSRIRVIHKENGGAGSARNAGLSAMTGSWFTFVDSDDYLSPRMYETMAGYMGEDVDLIECVMARTAGEDFAFPLDGGGDPVTMDAEHAMAAHLADTIFRQTPPNKLYRTETAGNIPFPCGTLIDDEFWTYRAIGRSRKLVHIPAVLYAYRQHVGSAMHRTFSLRRLEMLDARRARLEYLRTHFPALVSKAEVGLWGSCLYSAQMALTYLPPEDRSRAFEKIRKTLSEIPRDHHRFASLRPTRKLWWIASKISLTGTCKLRNYLKIGI